MGRVAGLGCLVCGRAAELHHVSSDNFKRIARSHRMIAPLCPHHHREQVGGRDSVEALSHAGFKHRYGVDLIARAEQLWLETEQAGD